MDNLTKTLTRIGVRRIVRYFIMNKSEIDGKAFSEAAKIEGRAGDICLADSRRKELFEEFIKARIETALYTGSYPITGNQVDKKLNPLSVKIVAEGQFKRVSKDIWESIEEYFDEFLTGKF